LLPPDSSRTASRRNDLQCHLFCAAETFITTTGPSREAPGLELRKSSAVSKSIVNEAPRVLEAEHPVVRTHPETGRKALYVNGGHTLRFAGMTEAESAPLLEYLFAHQVRPEFTCRFHWEPGSTALWDDRCALHNPINDYHGFRRIMHRVTLAGDRPR
jgi:taurine dioxygenase